MLRYIERAQEASAVADESFPQVAEHVIISDLPNLIFLRCRETAVLQVMRDLHDRVFFYKDPGRRFPEAIPDGQMRTFQLLAPFHGKPVIYLPVDDQSIFKGTRYRVTAGEYEGCVGILKRIKGEKRLIIKLTDYAAVATPHIPAVLLEDIDNPIPKARIMTAFRSML